MNKAVLISIKPEWCELIAAGEKTLEIRKTKPKIETPFKVYIYETKGFYKGSGGCLFNGSGKVIGEFVCDKVAAFRVFENGTVQDFFFEKLKLSCLSYDEIAEYIGRDRAGYSWHISDLVIYDKPKELNEFYRECGGIDDTGLCYECDKAVGEECDCGVHYELHLTRPPQSWCYVEKQ